ncbi:MAG: uroporphyrinogen-III synthase [Burkholderiaceae bacterium]|nr:uroporphyrinogen-III synthase [Burkholderiaceae bacterium]
MRVIVTRPAAQAMPWVQSLQRQGITAVALPLIQIAAALNTGSVAEAWQHLAEARLVMFVSANAVEQFFALRPESSAWPANAQAGSPGPGTTRALLDAGVRMSQIIEPSPNSAQFDSESLWERLRDQDWQGVPVRVVRGGGGRDWLADTLRAHGAVVSFVSAYRRTAPTWNAEMHTLLAEALARPGEHVWFFSSSESIDHLMNHVTNLPRQPNSHVPVGLPAGARALTTHPRIARRAEQVGFSPVWQCPPTLADVVACIQSIAP